jgi:hypothetical protein
VLDDGELFECECGLFEHMGIVCSHSIKVCFHFFWQSMHTTGAVPILKMVVPN